jgi:hypothetical protein
MSAGRCPPAAAAWHGGYRRVNSAALETFAGRGEHLDLGVRLRLRRLAFSLKRWRWSRAPRRSMTHLGELLRLRPADCAAGALWARVTDLRLHRMATLPKVEGRNHRRY